MQNLRLTDADRERYGGPEWLDTDAALAWLNGLPFDELDAIEKQMRPELGVVLLRFMAYEAYSDSLSAFRGRAWLALRQAGVDIALAEFKPDIVRIGWRPEDPADADPPADGASSPSPNSTDAGSPKSSRTSPKRTGGSTRGSGRSTR